MAWGQCRNIRTGQWNRIVSPEANSDMHGKLVNNGVGTANDGEGDFPVSLLDNNVLPTSGEKKINPFLNLFP